MAEYKNIYSKIAFLFYVHVLKYLVFSPKYPHILVICGLMIKYEYENFPIPSSFLYPLSLAFPLKNIFLKNLIFKKES